MPKRVDAIEKVTGLAQYADDLCFDNMLLAKQLYSKHPHAKILGINTQKALKVEGVANIITANDVPGLKKVGSVIQDHEILAHKKVRYLGDVVAVVAADSLKNASKACELIQVNYEKLEPVFDPEKALLESSPKVHDERDDNITATSKVRFGNPQKIFNKSDKIYKATFKTQLVEHAYLEPESCVAIKKPDGTIMIYAGTQHPFSTRSYVAQFLGTTLNKVRVIQTTLGGGFGGRDDTISAICARTALLAVRTNRPVKLTLTREESIIESYKRHPFTISLKAAIDDKHKIAALESNILADGGAYCSVSPYVIWRPTVQCTGPYKINHVHCDSTAVYTNNIFTGAMRGFGTPQYHFAIESFIDMIAHELKIDPIKFRQNNFFKQGDKIHTGQTLTGHKVSINEVVDKALQKFEWDNKVKNNTLGKPNSHNKYYGVGFACAYRGVSLGAEGTDMCSAIVNIQKDGSVLLEVGVSENGQGLKAAMTQILATELGIEVTLIHFLDTDTSSITDSGPTVASRGTLVGGNAVLDAAKKIKDLMQPVIEKQIGKSKKGYTFTKNKIINPNNNKKISFSETVKLCFNNQIFLYALGVWKGKKVFWDDNKGQGDSYFTFVYGCNCVEIEVDAKTNKIKVLSALGAHDVGKAINPQMLKGQIFGGMIMGLGQALSEEIKQENGKITTTNFNTYKIPRITDMPKMEALIIENPDPAGPYGAKSIGEPTNETMAAAIANAVFNATGVRVTELPIKISSKLKGER